MTDQEQLLELTESYLKSLVAEVSNISDTELDAFAPFLELGIDSFYVLKIIKRLEEDFGSLPKTLLFEHFNVNDLAGYFVNKHQPTLEKLFAGKLDDVADTGVSQDGAPQQQVQVEPAAPAQVEPQSPAVQVAATVEPVTAKAKPTRILYKEAMADSKWAPLISELFDKYKNESSVSRGTRNIAPNLFIGAEEKGYINYARNGQLIMAYGYTGPEDYFQTIGQQLYQYCQDKSLELNILADLQIKNIGDVAFSATPFGAVQRVRNLKDFTLAGSKMRRLRYLVQKFEKVGECRTVEYKNGSDSEIDKDICRVIDLWCNERSMVNPLVFVAKEEILAGTFSHEHRIFLTYVDDVLQNVIIVSDMSADMNGYLMDLEFYGPDMPLGGLEYAIVQMIGIMVEQGRDMLSLGATFGPKIAESDNKDERVDKILDTLREQNIFNDAGNLQFKNKFRPDNSVIYLCRAAEGSDPENIVDVIMMIADPSKNQTPEVFDDAEQTEQAVAKAEPAAAQVTESVTPQQGSVEPVLEGVDLSGVLAENGFNPLNVPDGKVSFDLKTDSWAQLSMAAIDKQMAHLQGQMQQGASLDDSFRGIFPFNYFVPVDAGRTAEHVFNKALGRKGKVLENLLFPTTIFHQIDNDLAPTELPSQSVFDLNATELFKGEIDLVQLQQSLSDSAEVAYVCVEISNNAAGGYPVTIAHLKQVKSLCAEHHVPLVLDGTRVVENALFCIEHEPGYADKNIWTVVHEIYGCADHLVVSLAKDFAFNKGGVVATNDLALFSRMQAVVDEEGLALDVLDKKQLALALAAKKQIASRASKRKHHVRQIWQALRDNGVPVVQPAGGHCVLIDVKQLAQFNGFEHPVASFLAWLYLGCGVRGGAHSVGMQKNSSLNNLVRLAIPVGLKQEQVDDLTSRLVATFASNSNVPELTLAGGSTLGDINATFTLKQYHNVKVRPVAAKPASAPVATKPETSAKPLEQAPANIAPAVASAKAPAENATPIDRDVAVVGMAGRYPDAVDADTLWQNLLEGKDSVTDMPAERLAWRHKNEFTATYRGAFLDDIDKFDSLFFNISPREAQMLDPQERLVLETAWEAIEDAGYYPDILVSDDKPRDIGVFVGAVWTMYQILGIEEKVRGNNVSPNSFMWSVANRISYFMNLSGPSLTLDTACSSSLTALYLACEAVINRECTGAIVGGVNLDLHQTKWDINHAGGALSPDGLCRAFGVNANGYVAGEGVGALYIKPLQKAVEDGDNIHGVIKSVVVNHGGKTSGYTVPSPKAQSQLIMSAMEKAGVDARTIGYVEAHGTGTELGDPIEINGLSQAFEGDNVAQQTCAIGSIKSNIGHLEAAAGVVSVTKVLLQMRHQTLVPSLHSKELNEFIDFKHSPFYVEQVVEPWQPKEVDGVVYPLRAGISSFGAGGSNAHVILEQWQGEKAINGEANKPNHQIFPLSARNEDQLRQVAVRLHKWLEKDLQDELGGQSIIDITQTLQLGRKSFDHRVAIVARSKRDLLAKLQNFIDGGREDDIITGHVKNAENVTRMFSRKEKQAFIDLLSQRQDPRKLAQLWIDGLLADWQGFADSLSGKRISLPTYPFADKRHWAHEMPTGRVVSNEAGGAIHPMVDANVSTFDKQLFKKTFTMQDFVIYDHLVSDVPTLPGVAYLEFARKVGELAADRPVRKIRNILWVSPIAVEGDEPTEVYVDLKPAGDSVAFEVFSELENGQRNPHSQGKLYYTTAAEAEQPDEYIDIEAVRSRVNKVIDGVEAYPLFKSLGLDLGTGFQTVQEIYKNDEEILGRLQLADERMADLKDMMLHPGMVDGSLQCAMGAQIGDKLGEMFVPFTIKEVEVIHPVVANCYSYIQEAKDEGKPDSNVSRINVFILDETGKILVKIKESIGVPLTDVHEKPGKELDADGFGKLYYANEWGEVALAAEGAKEQSVVFFDHNAELFDLHAKPGSILVMPGSEFDREGDKFTINPEHQADYAQLIETLVTDGIDFDRICFNWAQSHFEDDLLLPDNAQSLGVYASLFLSQALIEQKLKDTLQVIYLYKVDGDNPQPHNYGMNGFAKSLQHENRKLLFKTLALDKDAIAATQLDCVLSEFDKAAAEDMTVRYQDGSRYVRKLKEFDLAKAATSDEVPVYKEKGVYIITGGAGGLGLIFAEFLAKTCNARLVLTGRSELNEAKQAKIDELKSFGAEVLYVAADVADKAQAEQLLSLTRETFGQINGIVHSAGVLRDSWVRNKTLEDFQAVCSPKLQGSINLDELTKDDKLDFFVLFSSLSAIGGNAGQCDYAYANHYMDGFAVKRELLHAKGKRPGKTLSINWSLWADGGMQLDEQTEFFFRNNLGIKPLASETGTEAMSLGIAIDKPYFVVVEGQQEKLELAWGLRKKEPAKPAPAPAPEPVAVAAAAPEPAVATTTAPAPVAAPAPAAPSGGGDLAGMIQAKLIEIIMDFLKLDESDISLDTILLDLGFDSIGLTSFSNTLNDMYALDITPVLFFEYPTITDITTYLSTEHADACGAYHNTGGAPAPAATAAPVEQAAAPVAIVAQAEPLNFGNKGFNPDAAAPVAQNVATGFSMEDRFHAKPIAVVGMAGAMPQSENLEEFWDNLANAVNMITEIPKDRFRWEDFYGDPLREENKTNSKWGGFMKQIDKFDPFFFGISPYEAQLMDPQQRIFLETVYQCIEDSGTKVSDLSGSNTGLFVGVATNDYTDLLTRHEIPIDAYTSTGNSHAVLVNRVSFLLNFHGPSAPLDTACSSSLVATHRAIESMHTGSCDMAIVGGVQAMCSPGAYIAFGQAGMLSDDGKCKTFDEKANGYVRGEGTGAIFLKHLADAEAAGNPIYAIVKSTAENHGGRAPSLTAPNPNAQADLLVEAYEKAQVDPDQIGYIECHGTGTSLGDPIENQALKKALVQLYKKHNKSFPEQPHIGLGSVKTNIGHLETAAGVAGMLKILLALQNKQLPATIHFDNLNPYISLEDSPFYIVDKTMDWAAPKAADGADLPRLAGVSSFGFGGANAHIVFEEYANYENRVKPQASGPQLICLSAKNADRLKNYAVNLLDHIEKYETNLVELAYTLQVGRDEMDERLAFVAKDDEDLEHKLSDFIDKGEKASGISYNNTQTNKGVFQPMVEGAAGAAFLQALLADRELKKLAEFWVSGVSIDWLPLYGGQHIKRIALPTYPFAKERYWRPYDDDAQELVGLKLKSKGVIPLHPLVHRNTSTLSEQKFSTSFGGDEFYFTDHKVHQDKILPGVAYLEMARVAGELAGDAPVRFIRNLVWMRPIVLTGETEHVEIVLEPNHQDVTFTVRNADTTQDITHCRGTLAYAGTVVEPQVLDLVGIQSRCHELVLNGSNLYPFLAASGLNLGTGFQIVQSIYATEYESLAVLQLPKKLKSTAADFWLHPALMDGSLHTAMGMTRKAGLDTPLSLPFSIGEVQVLHTLEDLTYCYATWATQTALDNDSFQKVNFELLDSQGRVLVRLKDFISKPVSADALKKLWGEPVDQTRLQSLTPIYNALPNGARRQKSDAQSSEILLLSSCNDAEKWLHESCPNAKVVAFDAGSSIEQLTQLLKDNAFERLMWLAPDVSFARDAKGDIDLIGEQQKGVLALFKVIKALLEDYAVKPLDFTVVTSNTLWVNKAQQVHPAHAGIHGLIGSVAKECTQWHLRLLDVDSLSVLSAAECLAMSPDKQGNALAYRDSQWYVQSLARVEQFPEQQAAYKDEGVYVVIGGAGGLGEVFSRYMIERHNAKLVWIGRKAVDETIQAKIDELAGKGTAPLYVSADASDAKSLQKAADEITKTYKNINGVIHSAIVLNDQSITQMDEDAFNLSLKAKVDVSVNMDKVFGNNKLDFMLFFSSIISFMKTPGQSNYAAGCTFKDAFAQQLAFTRDYPVKIMNWGFWGNVGIVADESYNKLMEMMGIGSIEPDEGMDALEQLVSTPFNQLALLKTLKDSVAGDLGVSDEIICLDSQGNVLPKATKSLIKKIPAKQMTTLKGALSTDEMDDLVSSILAASMESVGLLKDGLTELEDLKLEKQPLEFYQRWVQTSIDHLKRRGILNDDLSFAKALKPLDELWQDWETTKSQWETNPNRVATLNLMAACLKALPAILKGEMLATDAMFPNSSMALVEGIYKNNILADFFNEVLGETLVACIKNLLASDENREIRIVEIGAGTGGTTAKVVPMIKEFNITEYCYTDLSKAFLMHGERHYKEDCPSLTTAIFDVTKPLEGQDIELGKYDLAIATNVLHATPNIRETIRGAKAALKADGVLLMNEISTWSLFSHLTFGLLEGWWLHEDTPVRIPGCPGISPESWQAVLNAEGYDTVLYPAQKVHDFGQQIIAAVSNGVVRQLITETKPAPVAPKPVPKSVAKHATAPVATAAPVTAPAPATTPAASGEQSSEQRVRDIVVDNLTDALKMEASMVNNDASFADYGVDSIVGVNLVRAISEKLEVELETIALFEHSTVNALTAHIVDTWGDKLGGTPAAPAAPAPVAAPVPPPVAAPAPVSQPVAVASTPVASQNGQEHVKRVILDNLCEALKMEESVVNNDASFADFGVDSIVGVNLVRAISETLDVELETIALFEHSTVNMLTDHIWSTWQDKIGGQLAPATQAAPAAPSAMPTAPVAIAQPVAAEPLEFTTNFRGAGRFGAQAQPQVQAAVAVDVQQGAGIKHQPIAIVGMSGKFSESDDLDSFWKHLREGKDLVNEVKRWPALESSGSDNPTQPYCSRGSFIDRIDLFDADFFGLSESEAIYMDPQQRLFLEESFKALEDAGYGGKNEKGIDCGIYVGCGTSLYEYLIGDEPPAHTFWGNSSAIVPARIAYHLNLNGPAISVDTACSSSLVCIHLACQGLWTKEAQMALAGGVYLQPTSGFYQVANRAAMLSPEGKCHSFDARADGFVPGEGVGVVVLKRLSDAIADGDNIHAVIAASGINQDGSSNGLIAPNPQAQEKLLKSVYERFDINPRSISFLEAHGTGTLLGDSIELGAANKAFRSYTDEKHFCALGTVKTNIGHAAAASGAAGVLKLVYSLKNAQLPPSLNYESANPAFNFDNSPFVVNTELKDWAVEAGQKRRCAISSFGFSGTNAHLVLEQAPEQTTAAIQAPGYLVVLSARNHEQLQRRVADLADFVENHNDISLNDLAYTLFVGRTHFKHRFACVASNTAQLLKQLDSWHGTGKADSKNSSVLPQGNIKEVGGLKNYAVQCIENCRNQTVAVDEYNELLATIKDMFLQGYSLEYQSLFAAGSRRVSLPVYPFARERYWVSDLEQSFSGGTTKAAVLHPLLHSNTSNLSEQRFTTTFSGREFFAKDLSLNEQSHLPAAVLLEMARAAVDMAAGEQQGQLSLSDIQFGAPVVPGNELSVTLLPDNGRVRFEIHSNAGVHCQGKAGLVDAPEQTTTDLEQLKSQMDGSDRNGSDIYAALGEFGVAYGSSLQGVESLSTGQNQVLAKLALPEVVPYSNGDYRLHPSILDSALQSTIGLLGADGKQNQPSLPQSLDSITIVAHSTSQMFAHVQRVANGQGEQLKVDVDLLDEQGKLCAQLKGLGYQLGEVKAQAKVAADWQFAATGNSDIALEAGEKLQLFLKQLVALKTGSEIDNISTDLNFFELGVTSLGIADMVQQTNQLFGEEISPAVIFEHRDIGKFASYLVETYGDKAEQIAVVKASKDDSAEDAVGISLDWPVLTALPRNTFVFGAQAASSSVSEADKKVLDSISAEGPVEADDYEEVKF